MEVKHSYGLKSKKQIFIVTGFHGKDGPISVSDSFATPKATEMFIRAAEELGYKKRDLNGEDQFGKLSFS